MVKMSSVKYDFTSTVRSSSVNRTRSEKFPRLFVSAKTIQQIVHDVWSLMEVAVAVFKNERDACGDCVVSAIQFHDVAGLNVELQLV